MNEVKMCHYCIHFSLDDVRQLFGHCKLSYLGRFAEDTCDDFEGRTCSTCSHWACMNRKELIGACTIWHDSGKTWPKSCESCPHWEHDKRKEAKE